MIINVYNADQLCGDKDQWPQCGLKDGRYVLARPIHYQAMNWIEKLIVAWRVFRGQYDALHWTGQ